MKRRTAFLSAATAGLLAALAPLIAQTNLEQQVLIGTLTNGPVRFEMIRTERTLISTQTFRLPPHLATNAALATNPILSRFRTNTYRYTNLAFAGFAPASLPHRVWTNFLVLTNGRDLRLWSERTQPASFPTNPPTVKWNPSNLLWGLRGMTALSPAWAGQGAPGQVALTALTRRHVYARGHGMGADGFGLGFAGKKAWFLTTNNGLIETKITRAVVRTKPAADDAHRDYSILLLDRDLPPEIEPMAVTTMDDVRTNYLFAPPPGYPVTSPIPLPIFQTEQSGHVSSGIPPLTVNTWKGGDSGSPNLIPLPGELVFFSGRSTTGPTAEMQADMDELCRQEKLDPARYQMRWVRLGELPAE